MQVTICDYCFAEGKITETELEIAVTKNILVASCDKKHRLRLIKDINSSKDSKNYQKMIIMIASNKDKRGKVFTALKKEV